MFTFHCIGTMAGCYWLLQFVSMCHLCGESRDWWWLWARWYGDHCLVSTLTLPRHPRVPMGHTAASPRPRVSSVSPASLTTFTPDSILCPMSVQSRQSRLELIPDMQPHRQSRRKTDWRGHSLLYPCLPPCSMRYFSSFVNCYCYTLTWSTNYIYRTIDTWSRYQTFIFWNCISLL